jgi:hypothetical protein
MLVDVGSEIPKGLFDVEEWYKDPQRNRPPRADTVFADFHSGVGGAIEHKGPKGDSKEKAMMQVCQYPYILLGAELQVNQSVTTFVTHFISRQPNAPYSVHNSHDNAVHERNGRRDCG